MIAELHTSFPERFAERKKLWLLANNGSRSEVELEGHWLHKGGVVLKFAGVDSISAAEALAGSEVQIPASERAELDAGAAYISDLVGCVVIDQAHGELGMIEAVQFGAGEAPLLVVKKDKRELLVPFAQEFVRELKPGQKELLVRLPEGLLDFE